YALCTPSPLTDALPILGYMQDRIGHKPALGITLLGWMAMVLVAWAAVEVWVFWIAAVLAGLCMGTSQSAGRAMVGAFAPAGRTRSEEHTSELQSRENLV